MTARRLTQLFAGLLALFLSPGHAPVSIQPATGTGNTRVVAGLPVAAPVGEWPALQPLSSSGSVRPVEAAGGCFTQARPVNTSLADGTVANAAKSVSPAHSNPRRIVTAGRLDLAALSAGTRTPFSQSPADRGDGGRQSLIFTAESTPVDENGDPVLALSMLGQNPGEDPMDEIFPISDENPFTMVIRGSQGDAGESDDDTEEPVEPDTPGDDDPAEPQEPDNPQDPDNPSGGDPEPVPPKPEAVLILPTTAGPPALLRTEQLDEQQFRLNDVDVLKVQYGWFGSRWKYDHFLLVDDFNQDALSDFCFTDQATGFCQLYYNAGLTWTPLPASYLSTRPTCATRLAFAKNNPHQIAFYSPHSNTVEILESRSDGSFLSSLGFPMTSPFDGIIDYDFNGDHYSDLIMNSFAQNSMQVYLNLRGSSLKLYRGTLPQFPEPLEGRFLPWPDGDEYKFWLCQFGDKFLIYLINRNRQSTPGLLYGTLSPGTCILLADFNQDGNVDIGFGSLTQ